MLQWTWAYVDFFAMTFVGQLYEAWISFQISKADLNNKAGSHLSISSLEGWWLWYRLGLDFRWKPNTQRPQQTIHGRIHEFTHSTFISTFFFHIPLKWRRWNAKSCISQTPWILEFGCDLGFTNQMHFHNCWPRTREGGEYIGHTPWQS